MDKKPVDKTIQKLYVFYDLFSNYRQLIYFLHSNSRSDDLGVLLLNLRSIL